MASTYRLGAPERTPARKRSLLAHCCCQRGSSAFGSYRSCTLPPLRHSNASRRGGAGSATRTLPSRQVGRPCPPPPGGLDRAAAAGSAIQRPKESHVYVRDIARHEGQEALLRGWLYGKRSSGKLHFVQLRDGTGVIQC